MCSSEAQTCASGSYPKIEFHRFSFQPSQPGTGIYVAGSSLHNQKPEAGSWKLEAGPEAGSRKPEAGSWKLEAGSRKPEAGSRRPELEAGGRSRRLDPEAEAGGRTESERGKKIKAKSFIIIYAMNGYVIQ